MGDIRHKDDAMSWCLKHNIVIYPVVVTNSTLKIEIDYKGKIIKSDTIYKSKPKSKEDNWSLKIEELYKSYYKNKDKHI